ncbi:hypothetical protein KA005_48625 [bacterium]|nr:hypothetical protein [bacterium]
MCAYFFGKGTNAGFDWGKRGREIAGPGTMDMPAGGGFPGASGLNVPGLTPVMPAATPVVAPLVAPQPSVFQTPVIPEAGPPSSDWIDNLVASMFGKGFETVRGIGERGRESVYDMMAREGLLGTGAAKGTAQDIAWQTERGITDLIREMAQMRSQEEKEAMNLMLTYMTMLQSGWQG